jgi:hypothetical protein
MLRIWNVLGLLVAFSATAFATGSRLQVIHNAADPAADTVDVYVNGARLLDDFAFRTATPFIDVPSGVPVNVGVAPAGSFTAADTIANFVFTFAAGRKYVAVANGVLNPAGFVPNPNGRSIAFTILPYDRARESGLSRFMVDLNVVHGATDAPGVDVLVRNSGFLHQNRLVSNLTYGRFSGYKSLPARSYILDVTPAGVPGTIVATFTADLSGLGGGAATVFASGFLDPAGNQGGEAFGLFAALPNGTVVELPKVGEARLQVIHNAADPAADSVDVYVNGGRLLDNFAFRTATPFITVPAGVPVNIGVAPKNSSTAADTLKNFAVTFTAGRTYVAVANGVLQTGFVPNPDGRSIAFTLFLYDRGREQAKVNGLVDVNVLHGSTDAPTVDVRPARFFSFLPLVNDISYGRFSGYLSLPALNYTLSVTTPDGRTTVAAFRADLRGLRGGAATVFASGFLNPSGNRNGKPFGLFAALPTGTVVELPAVQGNAPETEIEPGEDATALRKGSDGSAPAEFALEQNYPNPFNPTTSIRFSLPEARMVTLRVYDLTGREVAELVNEVRAAGTYNVTFDASRLASGMYIYRLQAGDLTSTKRLTLLK